MILAIGELVDMSMGKARTMLGWRARYPLSVGTERAVEWYREFLSGAGALSTATAGSATRPHGPSHES